MADKKILSNKHVGLWVGPDTAIADYEAPTLAELQSLTNVSEATKWDGFDFNLDASDQQDDRSLTDEAGAQSRSFDQFGGSIAFYTPRQGQTTGIQAATYALVGKPRVKLALVIRTVTLNSQGIAVGDVLNAYRVQTDANRDERSDTGFYYTVNFVPQDDVGVNCVVPAATPGAVTITPSGALALTAGGVEFLKATVEGVNVSAGGAEWSSSDEGVAIVTAHGAVVAVAAGTATINASFPGADDATPVEVTVS